MCLLAFALVNARNGWMAGKKYLKNWMITGLFMGDYEMKLVSGLIQ